jgi:hypothetical protein
VNGQRARQIEAVFEGVNLIRADFEDPDSLKVKIVFAANFSIWQQFLLARPPMDL